MASLRETSDEDKVRGKNQENKNPLKLNHSSEKKHLKDALQNKSEKNNSGLGESLKNSATNISSDSDEMTDDIASKGLNDAQSIGKSSVNAVKKAPSNIKSLKRTPQRMQQAVRNLKKKAKDINSNIDKNLDMFDIINYYFELIEDEIDIDSIEELEGIVEYSTEKNTINQLIQAVKQLNKEVKELEEDK